MLLLIEYEIGNPVFNDGWLINEYDFSKLIEFLNTQFVTVDYNQVEIQNAFDKFIIELIVIMSYMEDIISFNVGYIEQPFIIQQFLKRHNEFQSLVQNLGIMRKKHYVLLLQKSEECA